MDYLTNLPSELLDVIFTHLKTQDLSHLRGLNRMLNSEINSNASVISRSIVTRERQRIQNAMSSRPSFDGLTLIQTLRVYTETAGIPPPSPVDIELHARRLASWYRASNAKHSRGAIAMAWELAASDIFAFYFYLHHAFQKSPGMLAEMTSGNKHHDTVRTRPRIQQLRNEAWAAANTESLKDFTRLRDLAASTNTSSIPSPWQQPDALESALRALQLDPLSASPAQDTRQELSELRRISANVATAHTTSSASAFDTAVSGNPTAALEWALTQKAGLPASGAQFWFAPRPSARKLFESAIVRVRDFRRDPLLVAAVWECVDVRPV